MNELTKTIEQNSNLKQISIFIQLQLGETWQRSLRLLGVNRPRPLDDARLAIPMSETAAKATELAAAILPPGPFLHSLRTYKFGVALGIHAGLKFDREVFYLASIMHDLGIADEHRGPGDFEVNGARAAYSFLQGEKYNARKAELIHEAIALHTCVGLAHKKTAEGRLVHYGAGLDVLGIQRQNVHGSVIQNVINEYPRENFHTEIIEFLEREAADKPDCNAAMHCRFGLPNQIRSNPLNKTKPEATNQPAVALRS